MSKNKEYSALLKKQIAEIGKEVRFLEFKSNYQDADRLGKYISALSNGACLNNRSQKLKNSERLRAIFRAIFRAKRCNLLIFNTYFARKNMKITSIYERIYERTRKKKTFLAA